LFKTSLQLNGCHCAVVYPCEISAPRNYVILNIQQSRNDVPMQGSNSKLSRCSSPPTPAAARASPSRFPPVLFDSAPKSLMMRVLGPIKSRQGENGDPPEPRRLSKLRRRTNTSQSERSASVVAGRVFGSTDEPPNPKVHFKEDEGEGQQVVEHSEQIPGSNRA